jgi:hypothetical protein
VKRTNSSAVELHQCIVQEKQALLWHNMDMGGTSGAPGFVLGCQDMLFGSTRRQSDVPLLYLLPLHLQEQQCVFQHVFPSRLSAGGPRRLAQHSDAPTCLMVTKMSRGM